MDTRIGYHVEEKYFGTKVYQALSFAQYRANNYSREVDVYIVNHIGERTLIDTKYTQSQVA